MEVDLATGFRQLDLFDGNDPFDEAIETGSLE